VRNGCVCLSGDSAEAVKSAASELTLEIQNAFFVIKTLGVLTHKTVKISSFGLMQPNKIQATLMYYVGRMSLAAPSQCGARTSTQLE